MRIFALLIFLLASIATASANNPQQGGSAQKSLGTFGVWRTYTYNDGGNPVCYMVKEGQFPANKKIKRGESYLMITHRPGENSSDVVSYSAGYNYKAASDAKFFIGKNTFDLFTDKTTAWSRDTKTDHALAKAIASSPNMKITGIPATGPMSSITDALDLKGSVQAYQAIGKACGIELPLTPKPAPAVKKKHK